MIHDLCIIMLTAGITSLLFKLFKQPVVLGYIVAGMLIGPHLCGEAWISDEESASTWGEIGVLFLLFSLGLEFSVKKLLAVGSQAIIAAGFIVVGMMGLGYFTGYLLDWDNMNSIFLGGMLCMSSTTIVFKAIDDAGMRNHKFAKVCLAILIIEDLIAVVLMVLLSSIALKNSFEGREMAMQIFKLVGFLIVAFIAGIAIIPTFFKKFKKHLNEETLTIFSIGLCLGMVLLALWSDFSSALGAFVMGSILAETLEAERIERYIQPIKNIFGSVFFVSVGMLIDPALLVQYWLPILIFTVVVIAGQIVFGSLGTLISGQTLKVSLQTGFSLVQIGEFAFIIAGLGQKLGVTDKSLYPIVVAVSVITTFLTPYIMKLAYPTIDLLNAHLPKGLLSLINSYSEARNTKTTKTLWLTEVIKMAYDKAIHIPWLRKMLYPLVQKFSDNLYAREKHAESRRSLMRNDEQSLLSLDVHISEFEIKHDSTFCGKTLRDLNIRSIAGVNVVGIRRGEININIPGGERHVYPGDTIIVAGSDEQMVMFQQMLDDSIVNNDSKSSEMPQSSNKIILDNMHITPDSPLVGKTIMDSGIRERAHCIVMGVVRPMEDIYMNPDPSLTFLPGDIVIMAGERDSIRAFKKS